MSFDWNNPFANTRAYSSELSAGSTAIIKTTPTDVQNTAQNLLPAQPQEVPQNSVNTLNYGNFSTINATVGTQDQLILPAPSTKRIYLLIQNTHPTQNIFLGFGNAVTPSTGVKVPPGGNYELNAVIPQDDLHIVADGLNTSAVILYSNKAVTSAA